MLADPTVWEDYASDIAGQWSLCANCAPEIAGKKLFRQYNFNRTLLGLAVVTAPVSFGAVCVGTDGDAEPYLGGYALIWDGAPGPGGNYYAILGGGITQGKCWLVPLSLFEAIGPSDVRSIALSSLPAGSEGFFLCNFDGDGAPGQQTLLGLD